ncbi:hypothetical protein, variant, partial [Puccinia triticina 1-1 BBBD Race 1]
MQMLEPIRTSGNGEAGGEEEIEVNFKDQKMINEFSNLNLKKIKLRKLIKAKSLELDDLVELENELLLGSFDDNVIDDDEQDQNGGDGNDL